MNILCRRTRLYINVTQTTNPIWRLIRKGLGWRYDISTDCYYACRRVNPGLVFDSSGFEFCTNITLNNQGQVVGISID